MRRLPTTPASRRYRVEHRIQATSGGRYVVLCPDTAPRGFGKGGTPGAVDEQAAHRSAKGRRIARGDEKAGYPMHDDLADATRGTCHHRHSTRLRLQQPHAEGFVESRPHA